MLPEFINDKDHKKRFRRTKISMYKNADAAVFLCCAAALEIPKYFHRFYWSVLCVCAKINVSKMIEFCRNPVLCKPFLSRSLAKSLTGSPGSREHTIIRRNRGSLSLPYRF